MRLMNKSVNMTPAIERVVLAYSGGLETSAAIPWLIEQRATVVALTLDLGQERELEELRVRALGLGAVRAHVIDVRDQFARECILPALQSGICHDDVAALGGIAHPLIARKLVEIAAIEQATAVAHGAGAAGHASLEAAVHAINPRLRVIAVAAECGMTRDERVAFARRHGVSVPGGAAGNYDVASTLWGRAVTQAVEGTAWAAPPEAMYALTRAAARTPDLPAHVEVEFALGVPVSINGVPMPLTELLESVTTIAGHHGVGRAASVDSHTVYEAPAAVVLSEAHEALTGGTHGRATGVVRMKLFKGEHTIVGHSPVAVAASERASSLVAALAAQPS